MSPLTADARSRHAPWILAILAALALGCVLLAPSVLVGPAQLTAATQAAPELGPLPIVTSTVSATATATATAEVAAQPEGRPPQFVVLSFDGAGSVDLWQHWRDVGARDHANFTFFLSGAYLLTPPHAALYHGPRHPPGASDIGNLPTPGGQDPSTYLHDLLAQMSAGYREGHEIASHFVGHFCSPGVGSVGAWSATDWATELDQFSGLLTNVNTNNALSPPVTLPFASADVVGTRTPCLEGRFGALYPVLAQRGFRYDASQSIREGVWPERTNGIWSFPLASVPLAGSKVHVLAMDYNLYVNQSRARDVAPAKAPDIEAQAYATFMGYFERAYGSNRAPVSIAAHFTRWNNSAYLNALTRFADDICRRPEVRCSQLQGTGRLARRPQRRGKGPVRAPARPGGGRTAGAVGPSSQVRRRGLRRPSGSGRWRRPNPRSPCHRACGPPERW